LLRTGLIWDIFFFMDVMSAKEVAKYLRINEKKIYKLAQETKLPHVKIGGKVAFVKELIDKWILEHTEREQQIYVAGSDDILLRRIVDLYNQHHNEDQSGIAFYAPVGSMNGLKALGNGIATASCVHILDIENKAYTLSYMDKYLNRSDFVVIQLFTREQGIYLQPANPKGIGGFADIVATGATFVNRNTGSGTRLLFDYLLRENNIDSAAVKGYSDEAGSHLQAGLAVLKGTADCAFGIRHVAHLLSLRFIPQFTERFDMVIPKESFYTVRMKSFLGFFEEPALLRNIRDLTGYNTEKSGSVLLQ
jgi:putative molybdopterin biosynthesis protein